MQRFCDILAEKGGNLMRLKEISFEELKLNPMTLIGREWMLSQREIKNGAITP